MNKFFYTFTFLFSVIHTSNASIYYYTYSGINNENSWKTDWKGEDGNIIDVEAKGIVKKNISGIDTSFTFAGENTYDGNSTDRNYTYYATGVGGNNVYVTSSDDKRITFKNFYSTLNPTLFFTHMSALTIGDNISMLGNKSTAAAYIGVIMGSDSGNIVIGDNFEFIGNSGKNSLIATGTKKNGSISIGDNAILKDNISDRSGQLLGGVMYSDKNLIFGNNTKVINNKLSASSAASGGALYSYAGKMVFGDADVPTGTTEFVNNYVYSATNIGFGAALSSYSDITINGNAIFTGNIAAAAKAQYARGGAIGVWTSNTDAIANPTLQFNLQSGNHVLFRDNKADYGDSIYTYPNVTIEINNNGGVVDFYDGLYLSDGAKFIQNGNGESNFWNIHNILGNVEVNGGKLSIKEEVTLPSTIDATPTKYGAGRFLVKGNVTMKQATLNIHTGGTLKLSGTGAFEMLDNSSLNLYDSATFSIASGIVNIGNGNIINLAPLGVADKRLNFRSFEVSKLGQGNTFIVNSDLENNSSDVIKVASLPSGANKIKINYDPIYDKVGVIGTHAATILESPAGSDFEVIGMDTDYGVRKFTPQLRKNGDVWELYSFEIKEEEKPEPEPQPRPSQTVEAAQALAQSQTTMATMYVINTTLNRRMGELRNAETNSGAWIRGFGGESKIKNVGKQQYVMTQAGVDFAHPIGNRTLFTGVAVEHMIADSNLPVGKSDSTITGISIYNTLVREFGDYYDLVLKTGQVSSDMKTSTLDGKAVNADYDSWLNSGSVEYGYRVKLGCNGYYLQPETQFTFGRLNSVSYHTDNNIKIKQDAIDLAIGRIGLTVGKKVENTHIFASVNAYKNYAGSNRIKASDKITSIGLKDSMNGSWLDISVGANSRLSDSLSSYVEATKGIDGSKMQNNWSANVGLRYDF